MADFIKEEIGTFVKLIAAGVIYAIIYDVLRIMRRTVKHNVVAMAAEDMLFWIFTAFSTYYILITINNGSFRLYFILAMIIGVILYLTIVSRFVINIFLYVIVKIRKIIRYMLKKTTNMYKIKKKEHESEIKKRRGGFFEKKKKNKV